MDDGLNDFKSDNTKKVADVDNGWDKYKEDFDVVGDSLGKEEKKVDDGLDQFHKDQEKLFQIMSKNFALGNDAEANKLREQLKGNIVQEYSRLNSELEFIPPRLPAIQGEMKEELDSLAKYLEISDRDLFKNVSDRLWELREEMDVVKEEMEDARSKTKEKIEDFKKRYGNLIIRS